MWITLIDICYFRNSKRGNLKKYACTHSISHCTTSSSHVLQPLGDSTTVKERDVQMTLVTVMKTVLTQEFPDYSLRMIQNHDFDSQKITKKINDVSSKFN